MPKILSVSRYGEGALCVDCATLPEMIGDKDPEKAKRVTSAMLKMGKIEINGLKRAYDQK